MEGDDYQDYLMNIASFNQRESLAHRPTCFRSIAAEFAMDEQ
jgi:hypothetical protein